MELAGQDQVKSHHGRHRPESISGDWRRGPEKLSQTPGLLSHVSVSTCPEQPARVRLWGTCWAYQSQS